jgi:polysaccharide biosynthesis protein PslH
VYPLLKQKVPTVSVQLIGTGVTPKLQSYSKLDSSIKVVGYVDSPLSYIQSASAFIVPILSGSGTRLKLLEAMAAGKAIVTTTIGCEGIDGKDGEHYLVADEEKEFAERLATVLTSSTIRCTLGRNARRLAQERYDWKQIGDKMNDIYLRVCKKNCDTKENRNSRSIR